ncbi:hypothetical protein [Lactiplantibacillus plantarum]|uniref:hypothetical protein n=1 Tax=Lactiplantibacillus plantarum TaxID=1590 RepID=UPI0028FC1F49|nr:hypothetical protein [Lactiplantibacillus plantarum]WNW15006.1 hypothetical protein RUO99_10695 [Lactiplantibacillus plantarum]WNW17978.1 hypothetical protein RUP00_10685 [Lactiplantibacillus plantarum]
MDSEFDLNNFDFSDILFQNDSILADKTPEEMKAILTDYYSDLSVKKLLSKYDLDVHPSVFPQSLPVVGVETKCPFDGYNMYIQLPSKTRQDEWNKKMFCLECSHVIYNKEYVSLGYKCDCQRCQEQRDKLIDELKTVVIENNVNQSKNAYSTLSIKSILNLACLLQALRAKSLIDVGPYDEDSEDPDLFDRIQELFHTGLITPSENSSVDTFSGFKSGDTTYNFYPSRAKWNIWVKDDRLNEKQLFEILKNPHPGLDLVASRILCK